MAAVPPTTTPPTQQPPGNSYGGTYYGGGSGTSYGNSYVGNYGNLPSGISNAGYPGQDNAYVGQVQGNSLVQNQLQGLLAGNSPYIQQAQQAGINQANARGMLNSSIAAGNSQAAAIQAALPIAQQDASTYSNQQLANQQSLNQILQQNLQNQGSLAAAQTSAGAQRYAADVNNQGALARQREQLAYGGEQAGLNRDFEAYMNQLGYQNQLGLQNNQAYNNYNYGLGTQAFNLGGQLLLNNQNFQNQVGLNAMNNPFLLQNPSALGGYMDFIGGDYSNNINDLLNYSLGLGGYSGSPYSSGYGYGGYY